MRITQTKALTAYKALLELSGIRFSLPDSRKLMQMRKKLETVYEFQVQEETKLAEHYHAEVENGRYVFKYLNKDPDSASEAILNSQAFNRELSELNQMEIELDIEPVTIQNVGENFTPNLLYDLDGFVEILEDEPIKEG